MEYIVILLLLAVIGIMWFKQPNRMQKIITDALIKRIKDNRKVIAEGIYEKLPKEAKEDIPKEVIIAGAETIMDMAVEVIEEVMVEEKSK